MSANPTPGARELAALFALSAALLAYQVWLTRVIAVQHWHHLAPLVIAVALLGFGAAGILVSLCSPALRHKRTWLLLPALLAALSSVFGALLAQRVPLNMLALPWEWFQTGYLALYALCFLPVFFSGAVFIAVCFTYWPQHAGRVYAADLLGGAFGALAILPVIGAAGLVQSLLLVALLAVVAALLLSLRSVPRLLACAFMAVLIVVLAQPFRIEPAEYKAQAERQLERGSEILLQSDGLSQRHTVMQSPGMHAAPGLSLSSTDQAPAQWQWFRDGDTPVPLLRPPLPDAGFYRQVLGMAPCLLVDDPRRVLVLGAPALWQAWIAQAAGADAITLTTEHSEAVELLRHFKAREPLGIFPDNLQFALASPRRFLHATGADYDAVLTKVHSPEAGIAAAQEDYLLTREGLGLAFDRLAANGVLGITVDLHTVPRDTLRLVALMSAVLRERGLTPAQHLAVVRDWRSAEVMTSRAVLTAAEVERLREWSRQWRFDLVALPGLGASETNRYHQLPQAYFPAVQALLSDASQTGDYLFDISATTDNRPFFFHFFRWQSLPQYLQATGGLWRQHLEWGYLLGLAALLAGTALAAVLLVLPLIGARRSRLPPRRWAIFGYFAAIGIGFMLIEIGLLQKTGLLLDATAISMSAVLTAMLAGAGLGSLWQQRKPTSPLRFFTAIVIVVLLLLPLFDALFDLAAGWPLAARLGIVVAVIGLISVPLGFPLPHAIRRLGALSATSVAWAWAVNGFASVVGALVASLIAMHWGLSTVIWVAAACYAMAAACSRHAGSFSADS